MDLESGAPFWQVKNGILSNHPPLQRDLRCEVIIIGGGITGALIACFLTRENVAVALVDKRDVARGSTCASTGLLQYEVDTPLHRLIAMRGEDHAVRSYHLCLEANRKIASLVNELGHPCGFSRKQSLYLASRQSDAPELRREFEARRRAGIRVEFLESDELSARFQVDRPAALLSAEAAQIDTYRFAHELIERSIERGLQVYGNTTVGTYRSMADGVELTTDRNLTIRAGKAVFATGYETRFLRRVNVSLHNTYALASQPLPDFLANREDVLIWETARPYFYLRTTDDARVLIGGADDPFCDPVKRDRSLTRKAKKLRALFQKLFPGVALEIACSWAGTFAETDDGLAYIGETDEFPHGYFGLGYGGNGITYSVIAAEIIRDLYLHGQSRDAEIFRFGR